MSKIRLRPVSVACISRWSTLIIATLLVVLANILIAPVHVVFDRALVFVLIMLSLSQLVSKRWRYGIALPVLALIALDITLTGWAWLSFHSAFSYGFAQSVLDSNVDESLSMLGLYFRYVILFIIALAILLLSVIRTPHLTNRFRQTPALLLFLLLAGFSIQAVIHQLCSNNLQSPLQRVLAATPVSNANVFLQVWQDSQIITSVTANPPQYAPTTRDTGIDTYVLIIGESERTANMHIYGYGRETTPELEAQRNHLLLFRHAASGAPVTIMAVPLALTGDTPSHHDFQHYRDNIISVANQAGFDTWWFSRQGTGGAHNNIITAIASLAHHQQWVDQGYDDALVPLLRDALTHPGKKLIVLHLYGSHENACDRYPHNAAVFPDANNPDGCYDNSVHFTDALMGQVFRLLQDKHASVLYFSDHALVRDPVGDVMYHHAGTHPPHEAIQVPMFFWFSPQVATQDSITGNQQPLWSTVNNNRLMEEWMGITRQGEQPESIRDYLQHHSGHADVMDTTGHVFDWEALPVL
ncbi:sulfatase-like hydrolase/transferase [Citrobacter sp. RHBSTW-00013]|uniref:sulfatase-like hydrolase/transferase n=1 Tax=Citrobacter sp. RHBSTW-00013 TaxID=2742628 RepID=UPI0015FA7FEC|nr:sulfatase-like hydrolase/transferase [Citrobacter sp. RHBSTW-00013]MBA8131531.1 sulfatase-like hydrolase/transferase [Citrobacter sp. RHBSTW-00013]